MEIKTKIGDTLTNKYTGKIKNLLSASPGLESQQWKTKVSWPYISILEDNYSWDDNTEDAGVEEEVANEESEEEKETDGENEVGEENDDGEKK